MSYIFASLVFVLVILADQLSKLYIIANVPLANLSSDTIVLIDGVIDITHINNYGAAWGILGGYTWLLLALTLFIMVVCLAMIIKNGLKSKLLFWSVALILAGGIGNMIDRIFRNGAVVDFLQFSFWPSFPIFNIADIAVCVGSGLLILYFIVDIYKDHKAQLARFNETNIADK
jgi:signal peptidase II